VTAQGLHAAAVWPGSVDVESLILYIHSFLLLHGCFGKQRIALSGISKAYSIVAKGLLEGAPSMGMGGAVAASGTHRK